MLKGICQTCPAFFPRQRRTDSGTKTSRERARAIKIEEEEKDIVARDYVYALSRFGMPLEQFLELTPREFFDALWEREQHEQDVVTAQVRIICETIRMQTAHLLNIQLPKLRKIDDLKKIMTFKWESEKVTPAQT